MAKYLIQGNYLSEGVKGLIKEGGSSRRATLEQVVNSMGGSIESMYYAFGDTDVYVIADMPDNVSVAAANLMAMAAGATTIKTTVLLTPEEIDEAVKKTPTYRPPGQ